MDRPEIKVRPYIEWRDWVKKVEALLSKRQGRRVHIRDYANRFTEGGNPIAPYQDFWHWWLENVETDVYNGYMGCFFPAEMEPEFNEPWQREIYEAFLELLTDEQLAFGIEVLYEW